MHPIEELLVGHLRRYDVTGLHALDDLEALVGQKV